MIPGQPFEGGTRAVRFAALALVLFPAAIMVPEPVFEPLNRVTALMAAELLRLMGRDALAAGTQVRLDGFTARVVAECSVINPAILFASFVLAAEAPLRARLTGLLVGLPILNTINVGRIAAVILTGAAAPSLFEPVHVYVGQILMIVVVLFAALLWSRWTSADEGGTFPFLLRVLAWSIILFVPWLLMNRWYVAFGDLPLRALFELLARPVHIPVERPLYYQTFNSVLFASLVLATGSIPARLKAVGLLGGLALLWIGHQLFRVNNILFSAFGMGEAYLLSVAIHAVSEYLLPFLLWLVMLRLSGGWREHRTIVIPGYREESNGR